MNKRVIDGENYEENFKERWAKIDLEKSKSGSIAYIEDIDRLTTYPEQFHAHGETYLTSHDYGKNWREKIKSFQTEKEVSFYTGRLRAIMEFVEKYTRKDIHRYCGRIIKGAQQGDPAKTPKLIEQELKRLENISEDEFRKTDEGAKVEGKEMDVKEIEKNFFSEDIEKLPEVKTNKGVNNQPNIVQRKTDSNNGGKSLGGAFGIIGFFGIIGVVCFKRFG